MANKGLMTKNFSTGVYEVGCGCGGSKKEPYHVKNGNVVVFIQKTGELIGPVTGIRYNIHPNTNSVDIDERDAEVWLKDGTAFPEKPGFRGWESR